MLCTSLFLFSLSYAVQAQYAGQAEQVSAVPVEQAPSSAIAGAALTGDTQCSSYMCVAAVVNGSNAQYTLQSSGSASLGWMAMGFGTAMDNAAMVIMWPNSDNTVTLSQRTASGEVMPTVDSSPPRVATISTSLTTLGGSTPSLAFTVPVNSDTEQNIVWAFSSSSPGNDDPSAPLVMHLDSGQLTLDLTKPISGNATSPPAPAAAAPHRGFQLQYYEKLIIGHAILCSVGFLLFLPAGALLARYFRTFTTSWFQGHWIVQFAISGVVILIGVALGMGAVTAAGAPHFNDVHKRWGITILLLYFAQCGLGAFIHWVKPKNHIGRPPQNYAHAVLGLTIIALAFYQVRTGYKREWPYATGLQPLSYGVDVLWYAWIVILPVAYAVGMSLLPRQFSQERQYWQKRKHEMDKEAATDVYRR